MNFFEPDYHFINQDITKVRRKNMMKYNYYNRKKAGHIFFFINKNMLQRIISTTSHKISEIGFI